MDHPQLNGYQQPPAPKPSLTIVGLGTAWPESVVGPDALEAYIRKWYHVEGTGLEKLIRINRNTGIRTKAVSNIQDNPIWNQPAPPTIEDLDTFYRTDGVALAVGACQTAIKEWGGTISDITHVVAVTSTNAGAPGYDQLVARELRVSYQAERVLLSGVGCAGGLAALRVAANTALCATQRGRPARVLVFACELCSIHVRSELEVVQHQENPGIGTALAGDGAAALVLCNSLAPETHTQGVYSLLDWHTAIEPDAVEDMAYRSTSNGFFLHLSKNVPKRAAQGAQAAYQELVRRSPNANLIPQEMDWALHPGGLSILKGVQAALQVSDESLRASFDIYENRGNSSSVAVLAVLDKLRHMGSGKDDILACSFGPGLSVEAALLKRVRADDLSQ